MLDYYRELEEISQKLVEVQLLMNMFQNKIEKEAFSSTQKPVKGEIEFLLGNPQELKIGVNIFPPKVRVHPELLYSKNKHGPSTYSEVRDLWFTTIMNLLQHNKKRLLEFRTFTKALIWYRFFFPDEKIRDVDNFSVKLINDALVKCKIIKDDDHRIMSVVIRGAVDRLNPRTEIIITNDIGQSTKISPKLSSIV